MLPGEATVAEAPDDAIVLLPAGPRLPADVKDCIKAFLAATFPSLRIRVGEALEGVEFDGDDPELSDFIALPMGRIIRDGGQVGLKPAVPPETCEAIVEALNAFRACGWRSRLH